MKRLFTFALLALLVPASTFAQSFTSPAPLSGYAWSPNIGWISMAGTNYQVQVNPSGSVTGYAWSPNVGWLQFGGLTGCPAGTCAANVDLTTSRFGGWARALNYGNGWDGWVSLSAENHGGSTYWLEVSSSGSFHPSSYAWGSDVIGWTNFAMARVTTPCTQSQQCTADNLGVEETNIWCEVEVTACPASQMCNATTAACELVINDLQVTPPVIRRGDSVTLTWTTTPSAYTACRVEGVGGPWFGVSNDTGVSAGPINNTGMQYVLYCTDTLGVELEVDREEVRVIAEVYES